jgi:hypothetical protein
MTEHKWLDFSRFLNGCKFGLENNACPYLKFHQFDQYQKLELLLHVTEKEAVEIMHCCHNHRANCQKPKRELSLRSLELELAP